MTTTAQITVTRRALTAAKTGKATGKFEYRVDGAVQLAASGHLYTAASVYQWNSGKVSVFFHTRPDLAAKGHSDANRIAASGAGRRIPGIVEVVEEA